MIKIEMFEKYGLFDPSLRCCEDYDYWLRLAREERFLMIEHRSTVKTVDGKIRFPRDTEPVLIDIGFFQLLP